MPMGIFAGGHVYLYKLCVCVYMCVCTNVCIKDVNEPEACIHSRRMLIIIVEAVQYREPEGLSRTVAAVVVRVL